MDDEPNMKVKTPRIVDRKQALQGLFGMLPGAYVPTGKVVDPKRYTSSRTGFTDEELMALKGASSSMSSLMDEAMTRACEDLAKELMTNGVDLTKLRPGDVTVEWSEKGGKHVVTLTYKPGGKS